MSLVLLGLYRSSLGHHEIKQQVIKQKARCIVLVTQPILLPSAFLTHIDDLTVPMAFINIPILMNKKSPTNFIFWETYSKDDVFMDNDGLNLFHYQLLANVCKEVWMKLVISASSYTLSYGFICYSLVFGTLY